MDGVCSCLEGTASVGSRESAACVLVFDREANKLNYYLVVLLPLGVTTALALICISRYRNSQHMWKIDEEELVYYDPPRHIGREGFSVVTLATFRGSEVA